MILISGTVGGGEISGASCGAGGFASLFVVAFAIIAGGLICAGAGVAGAFRSALALSLLLVLHRSRDDDIFLDALTLSAAAAAATGDHDRTDGGSRQQQHLFHNFSPLQRRCLSPPHTNIS